MPSEQLGFVANDIPEENSEQFVTIGKFSFEMGVPIQINFTEVRLRFTCLGPEISPGNFEYLEGNFESLETGNFITGTFRVKPR